MIYYNKQNITNKDIALVKRALKGEKITKGPLKDLFEKELKKFFNCKYTLVVSSGTAAQIILARAMNLKKTDCIIASPLTFVSGANSIELLGGETVFVDIDEFTLSIDLYKLEEKIKYLKKKGKNVKGVMVTDYAGRPSEWKLLKILSKKYKFYLINDNCHALGAKLDGSSKYAVKYADFVIQSFHAVKNITTGEGGALLTNDKKIFFKAKLFAEHGFKLGKNIKDPWDYNLEDVGYNFRLSDINCALGYSQLRRIRKTISLRAKLAKKYNNFFSKFPFFKTFNEKSNHTSANHIYPLYIEFERFKITPKKFYLDLKKKYKIQLQKHYMPTYRFKYYRNKYKNNPKEFTNTENFYNNSFSLPLYIGLKKKQIEYICNSILKVLDVK